MTNVGWKTFRISQLEGSGQGCWNSGFSSQNKGQYSINMENLDESIQNKTSKKLKVLLIFE
jgi:hypothetical protein